VAFGTDGRNENSIQIIIGKHKEKRSLGRPRHRSLRKHDVVMWTRFILLSIGNNDGLLGIL
jgi:hypothetical protein